MKRHRFLLSLFTLITAHVFAQPSEFNYKRSIEGIATEGWYSFSIPSTMFSKINRDFSDLRIYNLTATDTTEVPYILKIRTDDIKEEVVEMPLINKSTKDNILYLTFKLKKDQQVNFLDLSFEESDFFGFVTLEGSHDQKSWFKIIDKQRIVSVSDGETAYKLSYIHFPESQYSFLRAAIKADVPLTFVSASFRDQKTSRGTYNTIQTSHKISSDKKTKQTIVDVKLRDYSPVSKVLIDIKSKNDFYRRVEISYVSDSVKTPKGWRKNYETFYAGYLTSFNPNAFDFTYDVTRELRITIDNLDNPPLNITGINASGPAVDILTKASAGKLSLFYGNAAVSLPVYDLNYFEEKIPPTLNVATLSDEQRMKKTDAASEAIFQNKFWLWIILGLIIVVLGFFTLKMLRN